MLGNTSMKNSQIVSTIAEKLLSDIIHELDSMYNPECVRDYGTEADVANALKWCDDIEGVTSELLAVYDKIDKVLIPKMTRDEEGWELLKIDARGKEYGSYMVKRVSDGEITVRHTIDQYTIIFKTNEDFAKWSRSI